ncbi:endolytic transglycosylase MltG [Nocardioides cavernaquae]|uniref:Endolytic murein transglycosylase n=1 Tax=Nocardioides cavernaquae TaxID=2321396 RepID=A0A3A5H9S3_9ACTN|nr:endolytic transglycosylase MltG [Nocardioides cavernaquae]RJS47373.1 endolytic transglycosylase MltG [Nocardioides cavernaquae]
MTDEQRPDEQRPDEHSTETDLAGALGLSEHGHRRGEAPARKRAGAGCILLLVLVLLMGGVAWVGLTKGVDWARDQFAAPADYPGPGTDPVLVQVEAGDTADQIGQTLKKAGVVASAGAYIDYARAHEVASATIQVGYYEVKKKMSAAEAFTALTDPRNIRTDRVAVPEGLRVVDVVDLLVKNTEFTKREFNRVLARPASIGLPAYAGGKAEGYLFPATYAFSPDAKPVDMLKAMVDRWKQAAADVDLEGSAKKLGYTPHQLMTIASLVEAEGRGDDMPKIARAILNRLEGPGDKGGTNGLLQIDATVNYALNRKGTITVLDGDRARAASSPYSTYAHVGLPPGPIEAPGDAALEAAAHPATGDWYFWVTVNLKTGETKFASTYAEHNRNVEEYREYCRTQSDRC